MLSMWLGAGGLLQNLIINPAYRSRAAWLASRRRAAIALREAATKSICAARQSLRRETVAAAI